MLFTYLLLVLSFSFLYLVSFHPYIAKALNPPSTVMVVPVTKEEASLNR